MSDSDETERDVLSKADEFLRRRRAQIASAIAETPLPGDEAMDDIPVLTEVVAEADAGNIVHSQAAESGKLDVDIERELDAWLDENLPQVVVHVMDGITDKLIQQVHASAREDLLPRLKHALRKENDAED